MRDTRRPSTLGLVLLFSVALAFPIAPIHGQVIPIGPGAFPLGSTLITFTGIPDGTEVNGLSLGGVLFSYSLGNGQLIIDGGPGLTNNIAPPNIVSVGANGGVLSLFLPSFSNVFGFGFAILSGANVPNATIITLFSGATNIGALLYGATPDPTFSGGFAGIQSATAFDRVQLTFNSVAAEAFAVDNIRFGTVAAVPEPTTIVMVGMVLGAMVVIRRRRILAPREQE
jgi:hypothetical protein